MNEQANITVLMSTYNGAKYLREQVDSILAQTGGVSVKLLVRDDGSKDDTITILEQYAREFPLVVSVIRGENLGFALSFSQLIVEGLQRYPQCDYFAFADQDDVWLPEKLAKAVEMVKREAADIPVTYCSNTQLVDSDLNPIRMRWNPQTVQLTKERCLIQSFATGCTMVFNRKAATLYADYRPTVVKVHDYLMYQMCMFLGKVIWDERSFILYRQHSNNQIGSPGFKSRMEHRFHSQNYKAHTLELQNRRFLEAYKSLLSVDDIGIISNVVFYRQDWWKRLSLLFNRKIKYTKFETNFFWLLKVLNGGGNSLQLFNTQSLRNVNLAF